MPIQVLLGIYLGVPTGIVPALIAWAPGFGFIRFSLIVYRFDRAQSRGRYRNVSY